MLAWVRACTMPAHTGAANARDEVNVCGIFWNLETLMQNLLLVEDHQFVIDAVRAAFDQRFQLILANNAQQMRAALKKSKPQLALLALELDGAGDSLHLLQELVAQRCPTIVLSSKKADGAIRACMYLGAHAFLDKSAGFAQLESSIDAVLAGHYVFPPDLVLKVLHNPQESLPNLTKSEVRVLAQLMQVPMPSNLDIAQNLCVSPGRIKNVITALFQKFNVLKRQDLQVEAQRRGYFAGMHEARFSGFRLPQNAGKSANNNANNNANNHANKNAAAQPAKRGQDEHE